MRKKEILARAVDMLVPNNMFFGCKYFLYNGLIVLAYHRVLDVRDENEFKYDMDLVSSSINEFDRQMSYISQYMHPVSEREVVNAISDGKPLPKRAVMVTFDDGFDDNYWNAFPILKKYSVPATIFISTQYIGGNEPIWFDWLASLFMSSTTSIIQVPELGMKYVRGDKVANQRHFYDIIVKLRAIDNNKRLSILDYLHAEYSADMLGIDKNQSRFLTWEQVIEMSSSLVTIGSHTVNHPILSRLDEHEMEFEITESKRIIEERTGQTVRSLSYPTGMESSFTSQVVEIVRRAGYKVAFTYQHGDNNLPVDDVFRLKRLHVEHHVGSAYFSSMMKFPVVFKD